jgi:hypothetical protein
MTSDDIGKPAAPTARVGASAFVLAFVAVITVLELARQWRVSAWDTIWAEDGYVFLADAVSRPVTETLFDPYGGYIHVLPRVAGAVAGSLPLDAASLVFALTWAFTLALLAAFAYFASAEIVQSSTLRLALAVLVAFLPAAGSELLGNATNLHFYLDYACFWGFAWRSTSTPALAARSAVVGVAALSDPLTVLFFPLVAWNALTRRGPRELVVSAVFIVGFAIQLTAIALSGESPQRLTRFELGDVPPLFAVRVTGSLLVGDRFLDDLWFQFGNAFAYGALALIALVLVLGAAKTLEPTRRLILVSSAYAGLFFLAFLAGRGSAGMRLPSDEAAWHLAGARFTYTPILFLATALLAIVDATVGQRHGSSKRVAETAAALVVALLVALNFSFTSERSLGPGWKSELAEARQRCSSDTDQVRVRVAPAPFGFDFAAECRRLR